MVTEGGPTRFIGHVAVDCDLGSGQRHQLTGFENHSGRTYLGRGAKPLGRVLAGAGNNGEDGTEGARYREVYATYLHGPVLPKNPWLADHLISRALAHRYQDVGPLAPLTDQAEAQAHAAALRLARRPAGKWRAAAAAVSRIGRPSRARPGRRDGQARGQGDDVDFSLSDEQRELTEAALASPGGSSTRTWPSARTRASSRGTRGGRVPSSGSRACRSRPTWAAPAATSLTTALVMEALGYGCQDNGLLFSLNAQMWSVELPLVTFGTPAQQQAYLPPMVSGDIIGGHAMTEPGSGSDALQHAHPRRAAG